MHISVLESKRVIYEGDVRRVILPCVDGEMCVMDYHQPFVCSLGAGPLYIDKEWARSKKGKVAPGDSKRINIKKGLAKMLRNELIAMVEHA